MDERAVGRRPSILPDESPDPKLEPFREVPAELLTRVRKLSRRLKRPLASCGLNAGRRVTSGQLLGRLVFQVAVEKLRDLPSGTDDLALDLWRQLQWWKRDELSRVAE